MQRCVLATFATQKVAEMKRLFYIISALILSLSSIAQNINYTVQISELRADADANDGGGFAGSQEPTWFIWLMDNGTLPGSLTTFQATGCIATSNAFGTWWTGTPNPGSVIPHNWQAVNNTDATTLITEMEGWENDCGNACTYDPNPPFFGPCLGNGDDNYAARGNSGNINILSNAPCITTTYQINRGDYYARLNVRWEYVAIDPGSINGNQSICSGGTPTVLGSVAPGSPATSTWVTYQWQQDVGCTGVFASIPSATNAVYTPPPGPTITTCYRRIVTDGCLTEVSNTVTVTIETPSTDPSSITATPPSICGTGTVNLNVNGGILGAGAQWVWYIGDPNAGGTQIGTGNPLLNQNFPSTTQVFVRAEGNCGISGTANTAITISVPPTPPTGITATQTTICFGNNTTLTVQGGSVGTNGLWAWYDTNPTLGNPLPVFTSTSPNFAGVSPATTTTYFVRAEGCDTTVVASITINVNTLSVDPTGITASSNSVCSGQAAILTVNGGLLGTGADWFWYAGGCGAGAPIGTGLSITVNPTVTTSYFVRAQGTCNNTVCTNVTVLVETLSADPLAIIPTSTSVCPGNFSVLSVAGGSLGTAANWQWYSGSCGGLPVGTGNAISVTPAATTNYFVRAEGLCNTTNCATIIIQVNDLSSAPAVPTSTPTTVCPGAPVNLTANGGTLGAGATYEWYSSSCGGIYIGSGNIITINPTTTTTYFSRIEGLCNTTTCSSITVNVEQLSTAPIAVSASNNPICPGGTTNLTVSGGFLAPNDNYVWYDGGCGLGSSLGTGATIAVSPLATTQYFVRAEGLCGNTFCASLTINMNTESTAPTSVVATQTALCVGQSTVLSVSGGTLGSGASWQWYSGACGGAPIGTGNSIGVSPSATTTYFVRAEGTCGNTLCESITIAVGAGVDNPTAALVLTNNLCPGQSTNLEVVGPALPTDYIYVWYTGACGAVPAGVGSTISVSPTTTTTYFVAAVGTCGTTSCASTTVDVQNGSVAASGISVTNNNFCSGQSTTLTIQGGLLSIGANWVWYANSCGGGAPVGTGTNITVSPIVSTSYYARAEGGICGNTTCVSVSITIIEHNVYLVPPAPICGTAAPFLLNTGLPAGGMYSGIGVQGNFFNPQVAGVGTHQVTYTHTNQFGCTNSATAQVVINATDLTAQAKVTTMPCAEGGVVIEIKAEGSGGYFTYYWSDGVTDNPRYYVQAGSYLVTVRDGFDCEYILEDIMVTDAMDCIEIPNSFTPNGDGKNDMWNVNLTKYNNAILKVFSRWGRLVYETTSLEIHWDGRSMGGEDLPANTYYYILEINGGEMTQNGPITILR